MSNRNISLAICASTLGLVLSTTSSFAATKEGVVTTSALNVRSGPSTSYSRITKVYKGDKVKILESSKGWHKIKTPSGKIGWSSGEYLSTSSSSSNTGGSTSTSSKKATVTASALNVRKGPSTSNSIVTKVYKGDKVQILDSSKGWHKIKTPSGKVGWASGDYLSTSNSSSGGSTPTNSNKAKAVVDLAHKQLGKPYVWGAEGPSSFDCSGLQYYIFKKGAGVNLPRTSKEQSKFGKTVSRSDLKPGDLIFSSTDGSGSVSHVGVYVGNNEMIHAPKPGDVVKKTKINNSYWNNAYLWSKRVL
ncbi:MAG: SH3 domain-containing protein [Peptostreptococcaceae bacterium]